MAAGKVVSFWSDKPGAGRHTLARELAKYWTDQRRNVLLVQTETPPFQQDPSIWVPRFRSLSPTLLRNFLAGSFGSCGRLNLNQLPEAGLLKDLVGIASAAYDWTLVVGP